MAFFPRQPRGLGLAFALALVAACSSTGGGSSESGGGQDTTSSTTASATSTASGAATCLLPVQAGPCEAAFPRWAFNPQTGRCEAFTYGGCEGNANNFDTPQGCVDACAPNATNACSAITCDPSMRCVYLTQGKAFCASPCPDGGTCPSGDACRCGGSCPGCEDCISVCLE